MPAPIRIPMTMTCPCCGESYQCYAEIASMHLIIKSLSRDHSPIKKKVKVDLGRKFMRPKPLA